MAALAALLAGCSSDDAPEPAPGIADYFPLNTGVQRVYVVKDCTFTTLGPQVAHWQQRETQGTVVTDVLGRPETQMAVDTATVGLQNWRFFQNWRLYADATTAERREPNDRVIVLEAPLVSGNDWNGNQFNGLGAQTFQLRLMDEPCIFAGQTFLGCIRVQQRTTQFSLLEDIDTYEIYAPGLGLIYRHDRFIKFNIVAEDTTIDNGVSYFREITLTGFTLPPQ